MNPREIVIATLEFNDPPRIPRQLWTLPWAETEYPEMVEKIHTSYPDDIIEAPPYYEKELPTQGDMYKKGKYIDEWGCQFTNIKEGIHGEVKDPLVEDWSQLNKVHIPVERLSINKKKINQFCRQTDKFVLPDTLQRPFERMQFIRRTDNLLIDLMEQPPGFTELLEKIHQFYLEEIEVWCQTDIDGIFIMDDWGAQNTELINPRLWRELFKPLYKEYIDLAHEYDKYAFMHSDGYITNIIPDLVELRLDALNSQLFCMEIEELGNKHAGKITFWGEIDRQHLLPSGSREDIDRAVKKVYQNLYRQGGVIGQCEFGPGARPENVWQVYKSWAEIC
ncbi:MAG: uroporphyrinogen decarboxylase family protein [Halanaerobiales bacterium]